MASLAAELRNRSWTKDSYLISTDASLISIPDLNAAFASDSFYWATSLPEPAMQEMLQNSLCFGLHSTTPRLVGFARLVTDLVTFAYVTDVWVDPSAQGRGLGGWLVGCVQETIESMPHLRRSLLFTGSWDRSVPFYERLMKMTVVGGQPGASLAVLQMKGRGAPGLFKDRVVSCLAGSFV
ncbi:acetyltransferase [Colletotrichum cereale]|nr:acetyltransferase [Colletotrichum cereale]